MLHSSKPQRFTILDERSHLTYNGLCRCSHNWNTFTSCTTSRRSQENAITYWENITFDHALTSFIRRYISLLQIPMHPCFDCRWTIPITHQCTNTGPAQQLEIYEVFNLVIPHRNFSAYYNTNNRYLGIIYDESKAVEFSEEQFNTCQKANGQFFSLNTPLQSLVNPPMIRATSYTKDKAGIEKRCSLQIRQVNSVSIPTPIAPNVWILTSAPTAVSTGITFICSEEAPRFIKTQTPIHNLWLPPACSATSQHFHLHYETHGLTINISLNTANLNVINISSPEFRIWQHLEDHWNETQLHHLVNIPSVPVDKLYKHMVSSSGPITPFMSTDEPMGNTASIWTLFSHTGIYIMAIGLLIPAGLGKFSSYFFSCQCARLTCWPLQSGSM